LVEQRAPRPAGVRALVPDTTPSPSTKPPHGPHRRSRQLFITNISRRAVVLAVPSDTASGRRGLSVVSVEIHKAKSVVYIML
jgi:hypothetical protein